MQTVPDLTERNTLGCVSGQEWHAATVSAYCRHYQAHVRSHFCTNVGVAGGLMLLQSMGAGGFTVDRFLQKKAT